LRNPAGIVFRAIRGNPLSSRQTGDTAETIAMDKLAAMRAFIETARAGGFAPAARRLGLSRSQVAKSVGGLEVALGAQLLHRTTRRIGLTEAGAAYLERAQDILAALDEAEADAAERQTALKGLLRVNAPMSFGILVLGRHLPDFLRTHPGIDVRLDLDDRFVDPVAGGWDVTIRIADLADSSLTGRRIGAMASVICASPGYVARHGAPAHPRDLKHHACLHYGQLATGNRWVLRGPDGTVEVEARGPLCSNNGDILCEAACAGLGIAMLPEFLAAGPLRAGRLTPLLPGWSQAEAAIWALSPPGRRPAKVRAFTDFVAERIRQSCAAAADAVKLETTRS
jgi:DNA-binding transcriptional LysR family regulator